jgi:hypothetical protein
MVAFFAFEAGQPMQFLSGVDRQCFISAFARFNIAATGAASEFSHDLLDFCCQFKTSVQPRRSMNPAIAHLCIVGSNKTVLIYGSWGDEPRSIH